MAFFFAVIIVFVFNIIFNIKSSQYHHITTFIPSSPDITHQYNNNDNGDNQQFISNSTQTLMQSINNELSQHNDNDNDIDKNINCNLLFCDKYKFDLMIKYYKSISYNLYPLSWIELNDQLFCPIKYSSSLSNGNQIISSSGERILKYIYNNQFNSNCLDFDKNKYLFYDTSGWYTGLGATTNGGILKYFSRALMSNRTLILIGTWDWSLNTKHCKLLNQTGFDCYFYQYQIVNIMILYHILILIIHHNFYKQLVYQKIVISVIFQINHGVNKQYYI